AGDDPDHVRGEVFPAQDRQVGLGTRVPGCGSGGGEGGHEVSLTKNPGREFPVEAHYGSGGSSQSTVPLPCSCNKALARLKGRDPKKPREAESGLGWALAITAADPSSGRTDSA